MDIMELGAIGELVGGVAVVGSLIFVGIQIRQGNKQIREGTSLAERQALERIIDRITTWGARVRDNPEINALYLKGNEEFPALSEPEKIAIT